MKNSFLLFSILSFFLISCANDNDDINYDYSEVTGIWIPLHPTAIEIKTDNETVTNSLIEVQNYIYYSSALIFSNDGSLILYEGDGLDEGEEHLYDKKEEVGKGIYDIQRNTIKVTFFNGKNNFTVPISISGDTLSFELDETKNYQEFIKEEENNNTIVSKAIIRYNFKRK